MFFKLNYNVITKYCYIVNRCPDCFCGEAIVDSDLKYDNCYSNQDFDLYGF